MVFLQTQFTDVFDWFINYLENEFELGLVDRSSQELKGLGIYVGFDMMLLENLLKFELVILKNNMFLIIFFFKIF